MKSCKFSTPYLWSFVVLFCNLQIARSIPALTGERDEYTPLLNKCKDFEIESYLDNEGGVSSISFPVNSPSEGTEILQFGLQTQPGQFQCGEPVTRIVNLSENSTVGPMNSSLNGSDRNKGYFTSSGHFHYEGQFYDRSDFCIKRISKEVIHVKVCSLNCDSSTSHKSLTCIPKCCGPDEVLVYWNFTCRRVDKRSRNEPYWKPFLYKNVGHGSHVVIRENDEERKLHLYNPEMECTDFAKMPHYTFSQVEPPSKNYSPVPHRKSNIRLLTSGRPAILTADRDWNIISEEYVLCVDGFVNWKFGKNDIYTGKEDDQVIFICPQPGQYGHRNGPNYIEAREITFLIVHTLSSIFLLLGVIIYLLLLEKQNVAGLTILSHLVSMFCSNMTTGLAYFLSLHPQYRGDPSSSSSWTQCAFVAVISHYFIFASYTWLIILTFSMWKSFSTMIPPRSTTSRGLMRFAMYSIVGWGVPLLGIIACVTVNEMYRDDLSLVKIPDYTRGEVCFVTVYSRGYYIYAPLAVLLSINAIFIMLTMRVFCLARISRKICSQATGPVTKYSVIMFLKLFCVMGVSWFEELLSWKYTPGNKPMFIFLLDCARLLQGIAVFAIFCLHPKSLQELNGKYPSIKRFVRVVTFKEEVDSNQPIGLQIRTTKL